MRTLPDNQKNIPPRWGWRGFLSVRSMDMTSLTGRGAIPGSLLSLETGLPKDASKRLANLRGRRV
jgi:hypothetical protein